MVVVPFVFWAVQTSKLQHGWWASRFFSAAQKAKVVDRLFLRCVTPSPHVGMPPEGKPCILYHQCNFSIVSLACLLTIDMQSTLQPDRRNPCTLHYGIIPSHSISHPPPSFPDSLTYYIICNKLPSPPCSCYPAISYKYTAGPDQTKPSPPLPLVLLGPLFPSMQRKLRKEVDSNT